jgi:DNA-binding IclR family transcriptional regulator
VPRTVTYEAPALEKGMDIIELLSIEADGLVQNEIAQRLKRSVGQIFRMLEVLERRGYIRRSRQDGRYRLTLKLFELSHRHPPMRQLLATALPQMRRLADETAQSIHMSVHHDGRLLVVAQIDGFREMGFSVRLGAHFPFRPDRVSARVITAFQDAERQKRLMRELCTGLNPKARTALERVIQKIRKDGYVTGPSDTVAGVADICFPILDASGWAIAAFTVPYVRARDNPATLEQTRRVAVDVAATISARLGHLPAAARR